MTLPRKSPSATRPRPQSSGWCRLLGRPRAGRRFFTRLGVLVRSLLLRFWRGMRPCSPAPGRLLLAVVPKHVGSIRAALEAERRRRQLNSKEATRMDLHANSALSWSGRRELACRVVDEGWTLTEAAEAAGVSVRCARKWAERYRAGDRQLRDRSSAPRRVANRTPADRVVVIVALRQLRMTAAEIAETLSMPHSTVSAVLKRNGLGRLGRLGLEPAIRSERSQPGELVHIDVKKLGRIEGG